MSLYRVMQRDSQRVDAIESVRRSDKPRSHRLEKGSASTGSARAAVAAHLTLRRRRLRNPLLPVRKVRCYLKSQIDDCAYCAVERTITGCRTGLLTELRWVIVAAIGSDWINDCGLVGVPVVSSNNSNATPTRCDGVKSMPEKYSAISL